MNVSQIKTATQAAIRIVGGLDASACITRVGVAQLSNYQRRDNALVVPVDIAVELDNCAQQPLILSVMAAQEGYTLLPIDLGDGCAATSMAEVASTVGDTMNATMRALSDGKIDQHEAVDLAHRLNDVIRVTSIALQNMQSLAYPERGRSSKPDDALTGTASVGPRGER